MDYCTFERIFVKYCTKGFYTDFGVNEIERKIMLNPVDENIDRYILLPAGFSEEDMEKYLGDDLKVLDKHQLSKMRNGHFIRGYYETVYSNDKAVERTTAHFKKYIPRVMHDSAREGLLRALLNANERVQYSDLNVKVLTDDAYFFDFLARLFASCFSHIPFNMTEYCHRLNSNSWLVDRAINDLQKMGLCKSVLDLIDMMYENRQLDLDAAILGVELTEKEAKEVISNSLFSIDEIYKFCRALLLQKDYIDGDYRKKVYELTSLSFCFKMEDLVVLGKYKEALFELLEILYDVMDSASSLLYDIERKNKEYEENMDGIHVGFGCHFVKYDYDKIVTKIMANMVDNIFGVTNEEEAVFESSIKKDLLKRASCLGAKKHLAYFSLLQSEYLKRLRDITRLDYEGDYNEDSNKEPE